MESGDLFGYILMSMIIIPMLIVIPVHFIRMNKVSQGISSGELPELSKSDQELVNEFSSATDFDTLMYSVFTDNSGVCKYFMKNEVVIGALRQTGMSWSGIVCGKYFDVDFNWEKNRHRVEINGLPIGALRTGLFAEGVHSESFTNAFSDGYSGHKKTRWISLGFHRVLCGEQMVGETIERDKFSRITSFAISKEFPVEVFVAIWTGFNILRD
jgi:hypothetical protein